MGHQPSSPEGKWDECLRQEVFWPPASRYQSNPQCTEHCLLPAPCLLCTAPALHLGADQLTWGRSSASPALLLAPGTQAQWDHTDGKAAHAQQAYSHLQRWHLGVSLAAAARGCRAHRSAGSPFSSLASAAAEFTPSLWFLGGTGCLCSPAQPPCIPSLSRTQARDASFILTPSPNLRAGRHSFARNESETVQRTNSLPP